MSFQTTVTKSISQAGLPFTNTNATFLGDQIPPVEATVTYGTPLVLTDGAAVLAAANLQLLYGSSDQLDCLIQWSDGTNTATFGCTAGNAVEWDLNSGTSPLAAATPGAITTSTTLTITPNNTTGATWNGSSWVGGTAVSGTPTTDVHIRSSLAS